MKTKYWNKVRLVKVIYHQPPARFCSCDPSPTVSSQTSLSRGLEKTGLESGSSCPGVGIVCHAGCIHGEMERYFSISLQHCI